MTYYLLHMFFFQLMMNYRKIMLFIKVIDMAFYYFSSSSGSYLNALGKKLSWVTGYEWKHKRKKINHSKNLLFERVCLFH